MGHTKCSCFIKHAITKEQIEQAIEDLGYARRIGDSVGITLNLAKLGKCSVEGGIR